ncbi:hypothetical protein [Agrococcus sp. KRD186]|uniref:hypothetical protein n=1 Tax=Agrococcus sp. KRD186 TaxID=2729730 RepID=UPI0019D26B26|nr:hypothetical protein [Agrococcus sp. KRD186]
MKNRQSMTMLERLNAPNELLKLFLALQVATFLGSFLAAWIRSAVQNEPYTEALTYQLALIWPGSCHLGLISRVEGSGALIFRGSWCARYALIAAI